MNAEIIRQRAVRRTNNESSVEPIIRAYVRCRLEVSAGGLP